MGDDFSSLLFSLLGIVIILFGCYVFSKHAAKKINTSSNPRNIRILGKVPLSQDKGPALAQICGKYYLTNFSSRSIKVLQGLSAGGLKPEEESRPVVSFVNLFQQARKNGWSMKSFDEFRRVEAGRRRSRDQNSKDEKP